MISVSTAAYVFSFMSAFAAGFQCAIALGAPWGEMAMGGKYPGRIPPKMRIAAVFQAVMLLFISIIVLSRAEILFSSLFGFSKFAVWFVVALCFVSAVLNTITPGKKERLVWAPITIVLAICSLVVAQS